MPVTIGAKPQADFDQPLDLMQDCHRRVEQFLEVLIRVAETGGGPLGDEQRRAMETALRYFQSAAPLHTEDEEMSVFPRMRQSRDPRADAALERVAALEADHRAVQPKHRRVDELGWRWINEGRLDAESLRELRGLLAEMRAGYERHIALEDNEVFPLAKQMLTGDQLAAIGQEMKARRAAKPGRPESRCAQRRRRELSGSADLEQDHLDGQPRAEGQGRCVPRRP